jgi:hypothetical protein
VVDWHLFLKADYAVFQHRLDVWHKGNTTPYKLILPVGDCFAEMQRTGRIDFFVPTSGLSFRKAILDRVFPVPEQFRVSADAYLMRTAFTFGPVYSTAEILGFYRAHRNLVYRKSDFDATAFFSGSLFPALNRFYQANGLTFQLDYTDPNPRTHVLGSLRETMHKLVRFVAQAVGRTSRSS